MKKKLSLLMVLMMTMSLIPFSAFAAKENDNVEIVSGIQEFSGIDEKQPVSILVDLGKTAYLNRGLVEINLKNVRTADMDNPVSAKFVRDGKDVATDTTVTFEDKFDMEPLEGNENRFVMRINGKDLSEESESATKLMITMYLDFSESSIGDVDMTTEDLSETGMRNFTVTIADFTGEMKRDMLVEVEESTMRIGEYGGMLSVFKVSRFDTLDSAKINNQVKVSLPYNMEFGKNTVVKLDGVIINPKYSDDRNEMTISEVNSQTKSLIINPEVAISAREIPYGDVKATVDFIVNKRNVNTKEFAIGRITDKSIEVTVNELGKTRLPSMSGGTTETLEVILDGIEGSFVKNEYVDFNVDGIEVPFTGVTVISPKGQILVRGESDGKDAVSLVNGYEVYDDGEFTFKILESGITQIKFNMQITADYVTEGIATLEISSDEFKTVMKDMATVKTNYKVQTPEASFAKKGTMFAPGKITITEAKAGTLLTGDKLYFEVDKANTGLNADKVTIKTTSRLELSKPKTTGEGIVEIEVLSRSYGDPAKIEIEGLQFYSQENAISGMANLEIRVNENTIYESNFVNVVGNIADKTVFKIGSKTYTSSGVQKQATEAPYIKNGYTMLPVRALADALGLTSNWNNETKTATFTDASRVATVKVGDGEMIVNGVSYRLAVPAEVKNGATMIELRSLATVFGVNIAWDNTQKTATVTN